eukprot:TRINITY_DN31157_c0_g1_i1.p1 TRINITY_DN31157_c0_g1~~TRINITY_DN31157_c0_g1_i1.p1  ORF type:complete len:369 (+),score=60.14 TRINITY_DN31157_c0_g1_i1:185-1291(+)
MSQVAGSIPPHSISSFRVTRSCFVTRDFRSFKTVKNVDLRENSLKFFSNSRWSSRQFALGPTVDSTGNGGSGNFTHGGGGRGGGGGGKDPGGFDPSDGDHGSPKSFSGGPFEIFLQGWRARVEADPQFPFKVLMEELVGLTACVLGDMACRPNFGLNELDFVFSTLVVGSILNFTLMYLLAPTSASATASSSLPGIFSACPSSHMFEVGSYGLVQRLGTFVYKGAVFGTVGFAAGLVGTCLSNTLISIRKKMDPEFQTPNKAPPTLLNSTTWALHMGLSSNFRYQTLNGIEFLLEKGFPPVLFKSSVVLLRCANNVLGGMSFVALARLTGSQKVEKEVQSEKGAQPVLEEEQKLKSIEQEKEDEERSD